METVEVVIRIPKKCKEFLDNGGKVDWLDAIPIIDAIANGIVLPKGHGRLIDADAATKSLQVFKESFVFNIIDGVSTGVACLAPTILEADKGVDDGNQR